jgi:Protein of unknown function (DUF760)
VDNITNHVSEFFDGDGTTDERLWQYIQAMTPETMRQLSHPVSAEISQVMERNISGMINGYFLRNAEQRLALEKNLEEL